MAATTMVSGVGGIVVVVAGCEVIMGVMRCSEDRTLLNFSDSNGDVSSIRHKSCQPPEAHVEFPLVCWRAGIKIWPRYMYPV